MCLAYAMHLDFLVELETVRSSSTSPRESHKYESTAYILLAIAQGDARLKFACERGKYA